MATKRTTIFLVILVGVLVGLNLAALATIWLQHNPQPQTGMMEATTGRIHHLLKQELGWDDDQLEQFARERRRLREQTRPILHEIHALKKEMFDASLQPEPDQNRIAGLAEEIGRKQALMEQFTAQHVMNLHAICTEDQRPRLASFLHELLQMGRPEGMQSPGRRPPNGRRNPPPPGQRPPGQ